MRPTWDPSGADRTQVGPMLAPWTLLSGKWRFGTVSTDTTKPNKYKHALLWHSQHWCHEGTTITLNTGPMTHTAESQSGCLRVATQGQKCCLVELRKDFQCIDYGLLHISEKFRCTVLCFNCEMPILLSLGLRGYVHYKNKAYVILCGCIMQYFMDDMHKIAQWKT